MKIVLTGGGTGGHFYPLIAVAQEISELAKTGKLVGIKLFYLADSPYDNAALFENHIEFRKVGAGKIRRYFSIFNFLDIFKTVVGMIDALWYLYWIYPDIIFGKGGYASFPVLWAARLLKIPVIIHESDSRPGRVNRWAAKFAARIAISFSEAGEYFPQAKDKIALTGQPVRRDLKHPLTLGAYQFLQLEEGLPIIYVTGGSQGAAQINETVLDILPRLLERCQIIHQTGKDNFADAEKRVAVILENNPLKTRYRPFAVLGESALRMIGGVAALAVCRAGAGTIFELAVWGLPAIVIPLPESISHDQRHNAFAYARFGGAVVIEQNNLTPSVLLSEISRLLDNQILLKEMRDGAKKFARPDAAKLIAEEIIKLALEHEA